MALSPVLLVFALAAIGVFAGARLAEAQRVSRRVLPISGILLIAISLAWVLPEVASQYGWRVAFGWMLAGFVLLRLVNRYVWRVCPACSHTHDHEQCSTRLHGFAPPLLIAAGLHSFIDGWGLAASSEGSRAVRLAFLLGIALHKVPEGLALGAITRAALSSHTRAIIASIAAEAMTIAGGVTALFIAERAGVRWTGILLAIAAGSFIYLGWHAVEGTLLRHVREPAPHIVE